MPAQALAIHGLTGEFLKDKPLFAHKVDELIAFLGEAPLVAHNAMFDLGFLNAELERAGRGGVSRERMVDTLLIARRKHPGGANRLDDLCVRYADRQFATHQARRAARCRTARRGLCRIDRRAPGAARSVAGGDAGSGRRRSDRVARTPGAACRAR